MLRILNQIQKVKTNQAPDALVATYGFENLMPNSAVVKNREYLLTKIDTCTYNT